MPPMRKPRLFAALQDIMGSYGSWLQFPATYLFLLWLVLIYARYGSLTFL
jgi:hypothetical protein